MKICAYVQTKYGKANYSNECMNTRQFAGLKVVIDAIQRGSSEVVEYAGSATVHEYDIVLVSITSDCDWWQYIRERLSWRSGKYKIIIGGAGVLNVRPFLKYADYFVLGRGEGVICQLIDEIRSGNKCGIDSIIKNDEFDINKKYSIAQCVEPYPHLVDLGNGKKYREGFVGCNHKCLFCGYTWHRKHIGNADYKMQDGLFGGSIDQAEKAMLDMEKCGFKMDFSRLRTTAIDGMSERLRKNVNKRISDKTLYNFLHSLGQSSAKPHQLKIYNIVGYPSETIDDWQCFKNCLASVDDKFCKSAKQWSIVLHSTPFRATPGTPCATWPMSLVNYRGKIGKVLGRGMKGNIFFQGNLFWAVESMGTESLPTVIKSAIAIRGTEDDAVNVEKIAMSNKFDKLDTSRKTATLKKYFDVDLLFSKFTKEALPTRYLKTYADV